MRLANHCHELSSPKDGLVESKQQEFVVRPPPIIRQEQYLKTAQQQPIGPRAIPPTWGQMDAAGRMKGPCYDPSVRLENHHMFTFGVGSGAPMYYPGLIPHNRGIPVNHPFHDSVGRHALNNVRFPFTANRFQYSGPSPTMVCLFPIFVGLIRNWSYFISYIILFFRIILPLAPCRIIIAVSRIWWCVTLLSHLLRQTCGPCIIISSNRTSVIRLNRSLCSSNHLVIPLGLGLCLRISRSRAISIDLPLKCLSPQLPVQVRALLASWLLRAWCIYDRPHLAPDVLLLLRVMTSALTTVVFKIVASSYFSR